FRCRQHAGQGVVIEIVADPARRRTGLSVTADGAVDNARIDASDRVVIDTETGGDTRPETLDYHIGLRGQLEKQLAPRLRLHIEHDLAPATAAAVGMVRSLDAM